MDVLQSPGLDDLCVCGCTYGDHSQLTPHRCKGESISRPGHACACERFRPPVARTAWWNEGPYLDRTERAAQSAAEQASDREWERAVMNGFQPGDLT